ncbi:MAG: hypothetical protein ACRECT_04855 [Thermoplasmata archaeon]
MGLRGAKGVLGKAAASRPRRSRAVGPVTVILTNPRGVRYRCMTVRRVRHAEDALARALLERYLAVRRGDAVTIETWSHGLRWARALVVEARRIGARPTIRVEDEEAFFRSLATLGLAGAAPGRTPDVGRRGLRIELGGPEAFPRLLGLPAGDLARFGPRLTRARGTAGARAVRLAVADATPTAAARYGVDATAWEAELVRASLVDPRRLEAIGRRLARRLARARRVRVRHPNGTDLEVERVPRPPIVEAGRPGVRGAAPAGRVPAGLLVVALRKGRASGTWEANRPAYDRYTVPPVAVGGRFEFRAGRLTGFAFDRGGEAFAALYRPAAHGPGRPVALTVGLNPAIAHAPELPELALGTVGLVLGTSSLRPGGSPSGGIRLPVLTGADVHVDGRPWLVRGAPVT